jgi:hypothetical protein
MIGIEVLIKVSAAKKGTNQKVPMLDFIRRFKRKINSVRYIPVLNSKVTGLFSVKSTFS